MMIQSVCCWVEVDSKRYESVKQKLHSVNDQLTKFLAAHETEMETRIRFVSTQPNTCLYSLEAFNGNVLMFLVGISRRNSADSFPRFNAKQDATRTPWFTWFFRLSRSSTRPLRSRRPLKRNPLHLHKRPLAQALQVRIVIDLKARTIIKRVFYLMYMIVILWCIG